MSTQTHQKNRSRKKKVEHGNKNFGARLRALCEKRGVALVDFAHAYNISESNLHNWLKREAPPLQKHWQPLADFFGCSVEYIAYGDGDENIGGAASVHEGITLPGSSHSSDGAAELRLEIHERINHLIEAANGDVGKLGWVREQLALHLRRPDHWATSDSRDR